MMVQSLPHLTLFQLELSQLCASVGNFIAFVRSFHMNCTIMQKHLLLENNPGQEDEAAKIWGEHFTAMMV